MLPGGSQVGMNLAAVHLDHVFGQDPKKFKAERWLKSQHGNEETFHARISVMRKNEIDLWVGSAIEMRKK